MRILLDESLPRPFARLLPEHDVRTVAAMGWGGKHNGELLPTNRVEALRPLLPTLLRTLETLAPRQLVRVGV